ncbi:hypothetical protein P691DRAFT_627272, partial [Macrolepiota fuliginosa MF-IS2]
IKGVKAHTGTPQCQQCWHWGHNTEVCCHPAIHCPICTSPHSKASHHQLTGCCQGNPKVTPPIPPTLVDVPCMHVRSCINCGNKHTADDHCCPYWQHHFNRSWIKDWAIRDASARKGVPPPPS